MGDDMSSHRFEKELPSSFLVRELFEDLSEYVPSMNTVVWAVLTNGSPKVLGFIITDDQGETVYDLCTSDDAALKDVFPGNMNPMWVFCRYFHQSSFSWIDGSSDRRVSKHDDCPTLLEKVKRELNIT